jgi:hypothetical protein
MPKRQNNGSHNRVNDLTPVFAYFSKTAMKALFSDILSTKDVKGVMLLSFDGELIFEEYLFPLVREVENREWWRLFLFSLREANEADLVFENCRLYLRKTELGYLLIHMGPLAPPAMIRLHTDLLLPSFKELKPEKGLRRLFRRRG